jgi:hypothetical protein
MLAASVAFMLGIPVFMERVMRPRYEERFEEFREEGIEAFVRQLEEALDRFKRTKEIVTPETETMMGSLFSQWDKIRTNETRLQNLLKTRVYLFALWMASAILSLFSIEYLSYQVPFLGELRLGQLTQFVFLIAFVFSGSYVLELFSLDQKLSRYGRISRGPQPSQAPSYFSIVYRGMEMDRKVEDVIKELGVPYDRRLISTLGAAIMFDYVIPSSEQPLYVVEVKSAVKSKALLHDLSDKLRLARTAFPKVKGILVFDFGETPSKNLETANKTWDYTVDFKRLQDLKNIVKL